MDTPKPSQSDQSGRTLSVGTWSGFAGANQSKVVDLLIGNGLNVCLVVAIVLLFTADGLVLGLIGALFALASLLIIGWLLRREVGRRRGLLGMSQAPRLLLMVAVAGGYLLRRPQDSVWVWIATGLALLVILSESTLRTLLGRTRSMATNLPGVPVVTKPPFNPSVVAVAPLAEALLGGILAAFGAPGWCYLLVVAGRHRARADHGRIRRPRSGPQPSGGARGAGRAREVPARVRRVLCHQERSDLSARHVVALSRTTEPAVRGDHAAPQHRAGDRQTDLGAHPGAAAPHLRRATRASGGAVDEGRVLRPEPVRPISPSSASAS